MYQEENCKFYLVSPLKGCPLPIAYCPLPTAHCLLSFAATFSPSTEIGLDFVNYRGDGKINAGAKQCGCSQSPPIPVSLFSEFLEYDEKEKRYKADKC
jgi:hypothetical protein